MRKIRPAEAAKALGVSQSYLAQLRLRGCGPRFTRLTPRVILYEENDLEAWAQARAQGGRK